ncbi:hypothetical protein C4D60_Mb00t00480 [Musa balbisiana]|uniref:Uncharacterized protein n=1 Tax=Musa balbisiana TaxID=52838 RepID=A0A4S8I389_MUSBA|nr:hypothetical protein C4D60_Mb00t00480 [Musa balbisiana]
MQAKKSRKEAASLITERRLFYQGEREALSRKSRTRQLTTVRKELRLVQTFEKLLATCPECPYIPSNVPDLVPTANTANEDRLKGAMSWLLLCHAPQFLDTGKEISIQKSEIAYH